MQAFLGNSGTDLFSLFDVFTGGAFSNAAVMAMGVSPYINASIIVQLLTVQYLLLSVWLKKVLRAERKLTRLQDTLVLRWHSYKGAGLYVTLYNMSVTNGLDAIKNQAF